MLSFNSIIALEKWLTVNGIDISTWGTGDTKRLVDLWDEVAAGDAQLLNNPPSRTVIMVEVRICSGEFVLIELEQEFGNGQRRKRERLPSEKMKQGEHQLDAAFRCLQEELGVSKDKVILEQRADQPSIKHSNSPSYPSLNTHYTTYQVEARVRGLPDTNFWVENAAYGPADPVKRHHWGWRREK